VRWRARRWSITRIPGKEFVLLALVAANLISMEVWPGWESLPLHLSFVALTLGYCAAAWGPSRSISFVVLPALTLTAALWVAAHGRNSSVEGIETALLTAMTVATIWRAKSRQRARRIFAGFSHEILTAMTVIRGHVELLGRRRPASNAEIDRVREVVIEEVERITDRVDGLDDR
jgi:signal transduction histidine kinase